MEEKDADGGNDGGDGKHQGEVGSELGEVEDSAVDGGQQQADQAPSCAPRPWFSQNRERR